MALRRNALQLCENGLHRPFPPVAFQLFLAVTAIALIGCDKIQIPGVTEPAAAPVAPVTSPTAPTVPTVPQQPVSSSVTPPPNVNPMVSVDSFLEKAKTAGSIEDRDLLAVAEAKEGLDKIQKLNLPGGMITDTGIAVLSKFPNLTAVDLSGTQVTDAGIKVVKEIPLLEALSLTNTKVSDVALASIADHPSLRELRLASTGVTDKGLELLDKLEHLEVLDISRTGITGSGFQKFKGKKTLRVLHAQHSSIQPGAFKFLAGAPIEDLNLDVTGTNDFAMVSIGTFKKLKHLRLEFCAGISDFGMSKLNGMKDLETLSLRNVTTLTSATLRPLMASKKLKVLVIVGTLIPASDAMVLKKKIGTDLRIEQ